jgi:hypothetical protein
MANFGRSPFFWAFSAKVKYHASGLRARLVTSRKTWHFAYRFCGKQRRLTLGHYERLSLAQARSAAEKARNALQRGVDPAVQEEEKRAKERREQLNTVSAVVEDF